MKAHDLPRPYRWAIPIEVVPKIDELKAQGHTSIIIANCLGVHRNTIRTILKRRGAYSVVPRP